MTRDGSNSSAGRAHPGTYRRRRLAVGVALVVTIALLAWSCAVTGDRAGGDTPADADAGAGESRSSPSGKSSTPAETRSRKQAVTVTVTKTKLPEPKGRRCRRRGVNLTVRPDADSYPDGRKPVFTVWIRSAQTCWLDPDRLDVVVTSGTRGVWSSRDCPGRELRMRRIGPHHPYVRKVVWPRTHSNPALCGSKAGKPESVKQGWYVVKVTLGSSSSKEVVFRLR